MEDPTRFDLTAATRQWQQELAAQSGLTAEDRRELEAHLQDSLTDLREHGLGDQEAFYLARRRVGHPQQLSEEFMAADPPKVWRERAFWFTLTLMGIQLLGLAGQALLAVGLRSVPPWCAVYAPSWWLTAWQQISHASIHHTLVASVIPFLTVLILLNRGLLGADSPIVRILTASRLRLVLIGTPLGLILHWLYYLPLYGTCLFSIFLSLDLVLRYLGLLAIAAWLMPRHMRSNADSSFQSSSALS